MESESKVAEMSVNNNSLIYEDHPLYDIWIKAILVSTIGLTLILGLIYISTDLSASIVMFAVTLFDMLLFHALIPRRYQIREDRLKIIMGKPFSFSIPFSTIVTAQASSGIKVFAYGGIRLATSSKTVTEILRNKGWNIIISPANRDTFINQLNRSLEIYKENH